MQVEAKIYQEILYLSIVGELDEHSANITRSVMDKQIEEQKFNKVVIDLSKLEFMDSTGIGVLIGRYKKLRAKNIPVFIANPSPQADKIFNMTALYDIMPRIN